jgi:SAM-dependent MidA family methyltransferase
MPEPIPTPEPSPATPDAEQALAQLLAQRPHHRITFAEYMDWALYNREFGYYAQKPDPIGSQGDFFTAPHLCADFGELVAQQLVQMWEILDRPVPFTLVEMGAGHGLLAADILAKLQRNYPELFGQVRYWIVEKTLGLQRRQRSQLQSFNLGERLQWLSWDQIEPGSIVGCCFSNELVDALPVHQVVAQGGQLQEVYLQLDQGLSEGVGQGNQGQRQWVEVLGDLSTPRLADYFQNFNLDLTRAPYEDGYRSEVNLAAGDWLQTVADRLHRGYVLTIDYGYSAPRYYHPSRNQGTLQCYYHHAHHNDPYGNLGQQDITAHVNFTALEQWGKALELRQLGFTQQALFLMALGLGDRLAQLSTHATNITAIQQTLQRRDALHRLIDPMGLGNFGVLIQAKGLTPGQQAHPLLGLRTPDQDHNT